jgi:hypothetical protein
MQFSKILLTTFKDRGRKQTDAFSIIFHFPSCGCGPRMAEFRIEHGQP